MATPQEWQEEAARLRRDFLDPMEGDLGLRERVWSAMHAHSCDEQPVGHDWREHLPWDSPEDEADAIALADALIEALVPRVSFGLTSKASERVLMIYPDINGRRHLRKLLEAIEFEAETRGWNLHVERMREEGHGYHCGNGLMP